MKFWRKIYELAFVNKATPFFNLQSNPDSIIALAFGGRPQGESSMVNVLVAQWADNIYDNIFRTTNCSLVAQKEIADHLREAIVQTISEHRIPGKRLDTREVLMQTWELGVRRPVIVAHPDHAWRAARSAEKIGFRVCGIADTSNISYDADSNQWWTKNRANFLVYDRLARVLYLAKGWI